ncbi:MAG TPA: protein kinase, partial [Gaiellaceae bacterium]|nr:protein kinase [Gaiellaceae bacterium]
LDYLAPEQLTGNSPPDSRSDIYALGVLLFELLTGELPFTGDQPVVRAFARCTQPARDPAMLVPSIDPRLRAVIMRCLRHDLGERFQRVADVSAALAHVSRTEVEQLTRRMTRAGPRDVVPTLVSG